MFIKNITLNRKNVSLISIMLFALAVASILIAFTVYLLNKDGNGTINIDDNTDIFNMLAYYTEYTVTINSNKNTNIYSVKEWYKSNDGKESFKFETGNEQGDKITYLIEDGLVKITNSNEVSEFAMSEYIVKKNNLMSIQTFITLFNEIKIREDISCCKADIIEEEEVINYKITFSDKECEIYKEYMDMIEGGKGVLGLELITKRDDGTPLELIVYNKENQGYIDITYNLFEITKK